jgi:hypothetical protein
MFGTLTAEVADDTEEEPESAMNHGGHRRKTTHRMPRHEGVSTPHYVRADRILV